MANPEKLHADTYPNRKSPYEPVEEPKAREAEALDTWFIGLLVWFSPVMASFPGTAPRTLPEFPILGTPSASSTNRASCWSSGSCGFSRRVRPVARAIVS